MKLIVGLGNPGKEFENTRHNAGFMAVEVLRSRHGDDFGKWSNKFKALVCEGRIGREKIALVLPQTFMNLSGDAVAEAVTFWKVDPTSVIVIYDDLDLLLGNIRIRENGSAGGHNGMKSIIARLGTQDFTRVRIGIGDESEVKIPAEKFVLQHFSAGDKKVLASSLEKAAEATEMILKSDITKAMSQFN